MKNNKLMHILFLLMFFVMPVRAIDVDVTIFIDDAYAPYSFKDEAGKASGIYINVLKTAFSRMPGFKVSLQPVSWNRGKKLMEEGEGFGLAPAFFHGHDWPYLYPYSLPFANETIISICHADQLINPRSNWPEDYVGLKVGNVAGFDGWGGEKFYALVKQGKIRYQEAKGSVENIINLGAGSVQCIMMEERAFDLEYARLLKSGQFKQEAFHHLKKAALIGEDPVYIGYSKKAIELGKYPFHMRFRQAFDAEIYKMTRSGEILKILKTVNE